MRPPITAHLWIADWLFVLQFLEGGFVLPEIDLGTHQDDRSGGTVVADLLIPLKWYIDGTRQFTDPTLT